MYTYHQLSNKRKKIIRKPEGVTKENIIRILSKNSKRFSDIEEELKITRPMLARHLNRLKQEDKIIGQRKGREVFYSLTEEEWNKPETRISLFGSSLQDFINQDIAGKNTDERLQKLSDEAFVSELSAKLGVLALYTIIKSYETDEKWYQAAKEFIEQSSLGGLVYKRLVYPKPGWLPRHELKDNPTVKTKINELYGAMKKLYPQEMNVMEQVFKNPKVLLNPDTGEKIREYTSPPQFFEVKSSKKP